ncbi:MAG: amidase [Armatimonadetes bacterium]|nr:amidase [Armatimonadota bacterium]
MRHDLSRLRLLALAPLHRQLQQNPHSLRDWVRGAVERLEEVEPGLQALAPGSASRDQWPAAADRLLATLDPGSARPPLFGLGVGVKDILRVDGFETRCGSALPAELFAGPEASLVTRLREAGAWVMAKTATTEFAYFEPAATTNPAHPEHTPGGSSSGSAAAVAAGLCPLALGSQTVGSVIRPAAFCGVVGFKPTYGRIALDGVIPYSPSVDTIGFFTQDLEGMGIVAGTLLKAADTQAALPRSLGIPEGPLFGPVESAALAQFRRTVGLLRDQGWEVRSVPAFADLPAIRERHERLIGSELAEVHAAWFEQYEALYRPRTAAMIRFGRTVSLEQQAEGRAGRSRLAEQLEARMEAEGLSFWICPSALGAAPHGLASTGDPWMNLPWTHAGMPALSLPAGSVVGPTGARLPVGLQVIARRGQDRELLAAPWPDLNR